LNQRAKQNAEERGRNAATIGMVAQISAGRSKIASMEKPRPDAAIEQYKQVAYTAKP
jgi:hypothetical protein